MAGKPLESLRGGWPPGGRQTAGSSLPAASPAVPQARHLRTQWGPAQGPSHLCLSCPLGTSSPGLASCLEALRDRSPHWRDISQQDPTNGFPSPYRDVSPPPAPLPGLQPQAGQLHTLPDAGKGRGRCCRCRGARTTCLRKQACSQLAEVSPSPQRTPTTSDTRNRGSLLRVSSPETAVRRGGHSCVCLVHITDALTFTAGTRSSFRGHGCFMKLSCQSDSEHDLHL